MNEQLLSVQELAEKLNVPVSWIYSRTREGQIPFIKCGKYCRFELNRVLDFLRREGDKET